MEQEQILYNKILCCNGCSQTAYMPFCFPIHNQPVMIVSAIPSLQAMYKPLSSIRFFRNLCYALLGDVVLRDKTRAGYYLREFCDSNGCIYWTHYRKCYQPELNSFDELDCECAYRFLKDEFNALRHSLKLIIVLGETIHESVQQLIPSNLQSITMYKPFPSLENVDEFEDVRRQLKGLLYYFKKKDICFTGTSYRQDTSDLEGNAVHLRFEHETFNKMLSDVEPGIDGSIEDVWHKNLTVPNLKRCGKLVQTFSFIENQIRVQVSDYLSQSGNYTVLTNMRSSGFTASLRGALEEVREHWMDPVLNDYVSYLRPELRRDAERLSIRLRKLNRIRNAIVHNGGLLDDRAAADGSKDGLPGMYSFAGTIFITQDGEHTLESLAQEVTELLCALS